MKLLKFKMFCFIEYADGPPSKPTELPMLHASIKEALEMNTARMGTPCDDPLMRGEVAECSIVIKVPCKFKPTQELLAHTKGLLDQPPLVVFGDKNGFGFEDAVKRNNRKVMRQMRRIRKGLKAK